MAGSDNHSAAQETLNGIVFEKRISDEKEFVELVKKKEYRLF